MTFFPAGNYVTLENGNWIQWSDREDVIDTINYVDKAHTPWTKLHGSAVSTMIVETTVHKKAKWVSFHTEEMTTAKNGVVRSKVHHITLPEQFGRRMYEQLKKIYE